MHALLKYSTSENPCQSAIDSAKCFACDRLEREREEGTSCCLLGYFVYQGKAEALASKTFDCLRLFMATDGKDIAPDDDRSKVNREREAARERERGRELV